MYTYPALCGNADHASCSAVFRMEGMTAALKSTTGTPMALSHRQRLYGEQNNPQRILSRSFKAKAWEPWSY